MPKNTYKPDRIPKIVEDTKPSKRGELPEAVWMVNSLYTFKRRRTSFSVDSHISVYKDGIEIAYIDAKSNLISLLIENKFLRERTLPLYIIRALKRFDKLTQK